MLSSQSSSVPANSATLNLFEEMEDDIELLFGNEDVVFSSAKDISVLCKELGVFPSTSAARRAGRMGDIPTGWSEIKGNKKNFLFVWNPSE